MLILKMGFSGLQAETIKYRLLNPSLTWSQLLAIDANIKTIKYGAGITLSSVTLNRSDANGVAFITNPSVDLRPYVGFKATLNDGAEGWIKAAGTGETLGNNLITGWTNINYATLTISGVNITQAIASAASQYGYNNITSIPSGMLQKLVCTISSVSGATPRIFMRSGNNASGSQLTVANPLIDGANSIYFTQTGFNAASIQLSNQTAGEWSMSGPVLSTILTPSTLGVTIVSTKDGSTQNWATVGTTPNAATHNITITRG